ncbi:MAG: hypothetical protein JJ863_25375 [Deltaproteobacteria bacterium]|nr:hypothetical protein [Deltaproteobacteria bacterium]
MSERAREGGLFFREADGITANVLLKKLRGDGELSDADPKSLEGFGEGGDVALAIHPPEDGWWAVVDSADGAPGVGGGAWSTPAIMANHLGTTAVWYRIYDDELGVAVKVERGGSYFLAMAGTPAEVRAWVTATGCPIDAPRPADAKGATLAAIRYGAADYESGPDRALAGTLLAIREAMESGDGAAARERCEALGEKVRGLGLAMLRGLESEAAKQTFVSLAEVLLAEPMAPRGEKASVMTFAEEVVRRVAEETDDDELFARCIDRLDAIESEAEARSAHAYTSGVERVGAMTFQQQAARSFECYRRLIARDDEPAWNHVNLAIATLLMSQPGKVALEGHAEEVARRSKARLPALGEGAKLAIEYNLACLYARAGDTDAALVHLARCGDPRAQNPHPERDTDLESIWEEPRFLELLGAEQTDDDDDDEELDDDDEEPEAPWVPPADRAVARLTLDFEDGEDDGAPVSRMGGRPNAPSTDTPWPSTSSRPMDFVFQLTGKAGGGDIDMGDIHLLQVFADMEGEYYEANQLVIHRARCPAVLEPPTGVDLADVQLMRFEPDQDDRVLVDVEWPDEDHPLFADHQAAWSHAWTDKAWGVPVGGNLDPDIRDSQGRPMRGLLQLVSHDDWFLWYVFVNEDFSEAILEIIRG